MKLSNLGFKLRRTFVKRGVIGTLTAAPGKIVNYRSTRADQGRQHNPVHPFDAAFGTDTSGYIGAEELRDIRRRKNVHNTGFYATSPSLFQQAFARMALDYTRFSFVDLGAGKGRGLLLAANLPFRQVIGVEFVPELQAVATRNIALYQPPERQCQDVQCILSDVCDFVFPPEPLVIFMWNPFIGPVFERVMANLEQSLRDHPRELYLVYLKPDFKHAVERISALHKLWEADLTMSEQDYAAYFFPDQTELCAAYGTV